MVGSKIDDGVQVVGERAKEPRPEPRLLEDIDFVLNGFSKTEIETLMELLNKVKHNTYRTRRPFQLDKMESANG